MPQKGYKQTKIHRENSGKAKKGKEGHIAWNKGKSYSNKSKGRNLSEQHKTALRVSHKGAGIYKHHKYQGFQKGHKINNGEKSYLWRGGISFEPYGLEFNEDLKEVIRNRDRRKCQVCEMTELENGKKLDCHHIDYNKQNNNPNNLISLCRKCHSKTNFNREYWIEFFKKVGTN